MRGDVGTNESENGVVPKIATTGLLRRKGQIKAKGKLREREPSKHIKMLSTNVLWDGT